MPRFRPLTFRRVRYRQDTALSDVDVSLILSERFKSKEWYVFATDDYDIAERLFASLLGSVESRHGPDAIDYMISHVVVNKKPCVVFLFFFRRKYLSWAAFAAAAADVSDADVGNDTDVALIEMYSNANPNGRWIEVFIKGLRRTAAVVLN